MCMTGLDTAHHAQSHFTECMSKYLVLYCTLEFFDVLHTGDLPINHFHVGFYNKTAFTQQVYQEKMEHVYCSIKKKLSSGL